MQLYITFAYFMSIAIHLQEPQIVEFSFILFYHREKLKLNKWELMHLRIFSVLHVLRVRVMVEYNTS